MPEIQINVAGARGEHPELHDDAFGGTQRDKDKRSIVSDKRPDDKESKDESAPGTLEWKEQG